MVEEGIAWSSDLEYKFKQPDAFKAEVCPNATLGFDDDAAINDNTTICDPTCCQNPAWSCEQPYYNPKDGECYRYHYPNESTTQYLYETYPSIISPLEGVTNEHFVVWMRIATMPTFRKLYGYINEEVKAGTPLTFEVTANYVVESFQGTKSLIVSTNNIFGGKNPFLGYALMGIGFVCIFVGFLFSVKHWCRPRKLADPKYLKLKEA